nr:lactadherin-like [Ciona intestinalis]|eukprot:XP_026696052.1 lactadherin-like [Ciona intestinalis]
MLKLCCLFTFCFLLHNIREIKSQQPEEICFRPPSNPNPGRPGKRGPPGGKCDRGDVGPTGQCVCDGMSQLRQEIQQLNRKIATLEQFQHSHTDKLTYCSVGMEDRRVRDEDITASATFDTGINTFHLPKYARLDNVDVLGHHIGAWASGNQSAGNWIQVDLQSPTLLTGVVTQGRPGGHFMQWITSYKIAYGINQTSFQTIQNSDGNDVIFQGNRDIDTKVTNMFPAPIIGRYVRLIHITYHGHASIRLEYLTC